MTKLALRYPLGALITLIAGIILACSEGGQPSDVAAPVMTMSATILGPPEEEIFGDVVTSDSSGWWAYLVPAGNLPTGATDSMYVAFGNHDTPSDWGWFEIGGTGGGCENGLASGEEAHRLPSGQLAYDSVVGTDTLETHCVDVGTWLRLDLKQAGTLQFRRPIDWINWNRVLVDDDYIYIDDKYGSGDGSFVDVVASFDTGETATISPVLEMTATQSPLVASWDALEVHTDGKYHIPGNFYVRVSPSRTTESSATYNQKAVLVRFFWNYGASTTATRFFSLPGDTGQVLARTYKYGSLDSAYDRTLVAQFALPQHVPNPVSDTSSTDYGDSLKLFLRIHPALTAVISAEDTVVIGDTVHFADLGQNGGGVESRFWSFGDGDTVTATAPSHVYTSSGTKTAVLTKTHTYHGLQFLDTATVIVGTPLVPGPIVGSYDGWPTNNEIEEEGDCQWEVLPSGGFGSYTYVWQKRKRFWATVPGATTQELYIADVGSNDFDLRTIISSGPLTDTTAVLSMTVDPNGQVCIIRK